MKSQMNKVVEEAKIRDTLNKSLAVFIDGEQVTPEQLFKLFEQLPTHDSVKLHTIIWRNPNTKSTFVLQYTMLKVVTPECAHNLTITQSKLRRSKPIECDEIASDDINEKEVTKDDK